ncbi:hypothetical protein PAGU1678_26200 [Paraclostridium bifermentans subsp. muricolitidis]|nr:hypothetical protein PAGU1678_26200 [Paraclostridium bifermentans subsp. muricolitidis]
MGFIIWTLLGIFFIGEGIYCIKSKKEVFTYIYFMSISINLNIMPFFI